MDCPDGKKEFYWQEPRYITFRGNSRLLERVSYNAKRQWPVIYGGRRRIFRSVRLHVQARSARILMVYIYIYFGENN